MGIYLVLSKLQHTHSLTALHLGWLGPLFPRHLLLQVQWGRDRSSLSQQKSPAEVWGGREATLKLAEKRQSWIYTSAPIISIHTLSTGVIYCSTSHLHSILPVAWNNNIQDIKSYSISGEQPAVCEGYQQTELVQPWQTSHGMCEWNPLKLPCAIESMRTQNTVHCHN